MWEERLGRMADGCVMLVVSGSFVINRASGNDCRAETPGPGPHGSEGLVCDPLGGGQGRRIMRGGSKPRRARATAGRI
ncbi:uncharacterized protein CTRU02_200112 [Colletotrichum truncatum]|uniref:Uncharacterized protein n=1 Tax=Colletotrichum truncatum TaxID=5467 RepID=A0ACC3ZDR3_COLTU|nr:uncharacterized protein CTRU02_04989 [Colletotrichum truncatum]KAF6794787.1 hypothetical protein CTRU02_04989 [Colletotrichum truncatum]